MVAMSLLTTLLLALVVTAQPTVAKTSLVKSPLVKHVRNTGPQSLVRHDQLRVKGLMAKAEGSEVLTPRADVDSPALNRAVLYTASVGVGNPATQYTLVVDTGSSNTWVGAHTPYKKTKTSHHTDNSVSVSYGTGGFNGTEFLDQVSISRGILIPKQSIGVASAATGFAKPIDGILGLGPVNLTAGTLSPDSDSTTPTVTDNLFALGTIPANVLGISFEPITDSSGQQKNGELSWGGSDATKFTGAITFAPITGSFPSSLFWGFDASIRYAETGLLTKAPGIADTGTSLLRIASDAFTTYQEATGGVMDSGTGLLKITPSDFAGLQTLYFTIAGTVFEYTPNAQIWPRNLNTHIGGTAGSIYLIVSNLGTLSGVGLDFILGLTFLERFYSVYDTGNNQIGFATTRFTTATTN